MASSSNSTAAFIQLALLDDAAFMRALREELEVFDLPHGEVLEVPVTPGVEVHYFVPAAPATPPAESAAPSPYVPATPPSVAPYPPAGSQSFRSLQSSSLLRNGGAEAPQHQHYQQPSYFHSNGGNPATPIKPFNVPPFRVVPNTAPQTRTLGGRGSSLGSGSETARPSMALKRHIDLAATHYAAEGSEAGYPEVFKYGSTGVGSTNSQFNTNQHTIPHTARPHYSSSFSSPFGDVMGDNNSNSTANMSSTSGNPNNNIGSRFPFPRPPPTSAISMGSSLPPQRGGSLGPTTTSSMSGVVGASPYRTPTAPPGGLAHHHHTLSTTGASLVGGSASSPALGSSGGSALGSAAPPPNKYAALYSTLPNSDQQACVKRPIDLLFINGGARRAPRPPPAPAAHVVGDVGLGGASIGYNKPASKAW